MWNHCRNKKERINYIEKDKKPHDKTVLLAKSKVNSIKVLLYNALIDSCISHDIFVSVNNVLREYYEIKEDMKHPKTSVEYII